MLAPVSTRKRTGAPSTSATSPVVAVGAAGDAARIGRLHVARAGQHRAARRQGGQGGDGHDAQFLHHHRLFARTNRFSAPLSLGNHRAVQIG